MLSLGKISIQGKNLASIHTSSVTCANKSKWKWAHRQDLRDFNGEKLAELRDAAKTDEESKLALKDMEYENQRWMAGADQEDIAQRLLRMLKNSSYNLPNGGFRKGIFQEYLTTLETPQQLNIVIQCLNVWQQKQFKRTEDQVNSIPDNLSALVCKAAARVGAPDLGLSYMQMPWVNTTHSRNSIHVLLNRYAIDAESWILAKRAAGESIIAPPNFKEIRSMSKGGNKEANEDDDEDEESEEEETEEGKEKRLKSFFDHWINSFMQTYREARLDKYEWSANEETYGYVARFYSSLGDCDAALQILETFPNVDMKTKDIIVLGLISKDRVKEASGLVASGKSTFATGAFAIALASNNRTEAVAQAKKAIELFNKIKSEEEKAKKIPFFKLHFGVPERIELLQSIANEELKGLLAENDLTYIMSLEGPVKEEIQKEEGEEGEEKKEANIE